MAFSWRRRNQSLLSARVVGVRQGRSFRGGQCRRGSPASPRIALLTFAQQRGHGHVQVLAQQVQQGRFHRRHGVHARAQIKVCRPRPPESRSAQLLLHPLQHPLVGANGLADHQLRALPASGVSFAAGHPAHPGAAGAVLEHDQIAGEERRVGTAQVHQHAVAARHGDGAQFVSQRGWKTGSWSE